MKHTLDSSLDRFGLLHIMQPICVLHLSISANLKHAYCLFSHQMCPTSLISPIKQSVRNGCAQCNKQGFLVVWPQVIDKIAKSIEDKDQSEESTSSQVRCTNCTVVRYKSCTMKTVNTRKGDNVYQMAITCPFRLQIKVSVTRQPIEAKSFLVCLPLPLHLISVPFGLNRTDLSSIQQDVFRRTSPHCPVSYQLTANLLYRSQGKFCITLQAIFKFNFVCLSHRIMPRWQFWVPAVASVSHFRCF